MIGLTWDGTPNPSRETKFSGVNGDSARLIFSVQVITNRVGTLTRLIHPLLKVLTIQSVAAPCVTEVRAVGKRCDRREAVDRRKI